MELSFNVSDINCDNNGSITVSVNNTQINSYQWDSGHNSTTIDSLSNTGTYTVTVTDTNACFNIDSTSIQNISPGLSTSSSNVLCYGDSTGMASANMSSGSAPYTNSWSSNLLTQTYNDNFDSGSYDTNIWGSVLGGSLGDRN